MRRKNKKNTKAEKRFHHLLASVLFFILTVFLFEKASLVAQAGGRGAEMPHKSSYRSIKLGAEDSLESIALKYNKKQLRSDKEYVEAIQHLNGMHGEKLYPGCYLTVICYE